MAYKNPIDLSDHQIVTVTVGDIRSLLLLLEAISSHLILPSEADAAFERLRKIIH
jgi:hypothetical protein